MTATPPVIESEPVVKTRRVQYDVQRSYEDIPEGYPLTREALEKDLRDTISGHHGARAAADCMKHVEWTRTAPGWPGGRATLRARLNVTFQQA
jgi:hypothetical protein